MVGSLGYLVVYRQQSESPTQRLPEKSGQAIYAGFGSKQPKRNNLHLISINEQKKIK
jgi:hypothetical protein